MQNPAATYIQAHFKEVLGVDVIPRSIEEKTFSDALNKHTQNLFLVKYGFDYMDPSNYMDLFLTGGRHAWSNPEYDELVREADSIEDWEKRIEKYRKAEKILVQEAPAVFLFQRIMSAVWEPYIKGEGVETNKNGITGWGNMWVYYVMTHIYVAKH